MKVSNIKHGKLGTFLKIFVALVIMYLGSWWATYYFGKISIEQKWDAHFKGDKTRLAHKILVLDNPFEDQKYIRNTVPMPAYFVGNTSSPFPFIVSIDIAEFTEGSAGGSRVDYFWFLGYKRGIRSTNWSSH